MKFNQKGFSAIEGLLILIIVGALAGVGWYVFNAKNKTDNTLQKTNQAQAPAQKQDASVQKITHASTVTSGKELFDVTFPDGWSGILRAKDSDLIIIPGQKQPETKKGELPTIENIDGYTKDEPYVLRIQVFGSLIDATGDVENFAIGRDDESVVGKKYTYVYDTDAKDSHGVTRIKGDRDYEYRFPLKNSSGQLVIEYKIYGSDPKNNIDTVEQVIKSITFRRPFTTN